MARHVRVSASKARRVVNLVRGMSARQALTVLQFAPQAASEPVYKVVASAIANAENNERLDGDSLLISEIFVDEGPTLKRFRPRAQGRAYRIRKRTCHITVVVESVQAGQPKALRVGAPVKKATAPAAAAPAAAVSTAEVEADEAPATPVKKAATKKAAPAKAAAEPATDESAEAPAAADESETPEEESGE